MHWKYIVKCFAKCIHLCDHHHDKDIIHFQDSKSSLVPLMAPINQSGHLLSLTLPILDFSCKRDHPLCTLLYPASFTQCNTSEIHPCYQMHR